MSEEQDKYEQELNQPVRQLRDKVVSEEDKFKPVDRTAEVKKNVSPKLKVIEQPQTLTAEQREKIDANSLLRALVANKASDLHISANSPIKIRINGRLKSLIVNGAPLVLAAEDTQRILLDIAKERQQAIFDEKHELDFAYSIPGLARFRVNLFFSKGAISGVFRIIPHEILSLEQLKMPTVLKELANSPRGLVLVTGPTGSGKSTTLAAMVDYINRNREQHILTIEDPIEFVHDSKKSLVSQRELHSDTYSFANALRAALREDPDVILVGEMRDPETIELGITAAETGHLVFATLHTQDASQTIDRLVDSFPEGQQNQVRSQLSLALRGVVSQQLIRTQDGKGRVAGLEILINNTGIANALRQGKTEQIYSQIQTGAKYGMQTMDASLADLVSEGKINKQIASTISSNPGELDKMLTGRIKLETAAAQNK